MTFDRFIKQLFAEELSGFPNTVYKDDCWYSFTPQGVMHQVFVHRRRSGVIWLEYGSTALVSDELSPVPGNSIQRMILGRRPRNIANLEYAPHPDPNIAEVEKATTKNADLFRDLLNKIIFPFFSKISTIGDLYQACCRRGRAVAEEQTQSGDYPSPLAFSFTSVRHAFLICAYLGYIDQGLQWIQESRMHDLYFYSSRYNPNLKGTAEYHATIRECQTEFSEEEQFLHQSKEFQRAKLRENFEENRVIIHDFLGIDPEFDMDFIFPEG